MVYYPPYFFVSVELLFDVIPSILNCLFGNFHGTFMALSWRSPWHFHETFMDCCQKWIVARNGLLPEMDYGLLPDGLLPKTDV